MSPVSQLPIIVGHRGASGYEPENTLRSFKRAIEMGVQMIELDVHLCKSGEIIVLHDDTIDRTTNGTGSVKELSWDVLKTYDAGKGEHIPLLSQVFDLVDRRVAIITEIKDPQAVQPVAQLIDDYVREKGWSYNDFIVASFDHDAIVRFSALCPLVKTGAVFDEHENDIVARTVRAQAAYAMVHHNSVTQKLIAEAHAHAIKVFAYTINTKFLAQQVSVLHIDGIITNYPDVLHK